MPTEVVKVVDPDNGTGTDYTSLDNWEDNYGGIAGSGDCVTNDQIAVAKCRCTNGTADSSRGTDSTRHANIRTDTSEC